jgi:hypothetical protein
MSEFKHLKETKKRGSWLGGRKSSSSGTVSPTADDQELAEGVS